MAILALAVLAFSACGGRETPPAHAAGPTPSLFASSRAPAVGFHGTLGFQLTQNTIQLNAQLGPASPTRTFVLDSGAPMTISPRLANALELPALAQVALLGPESNRRSVDVVRIPQLVVAGLPFREVAAVVDWVEPPSPVACLSTAGLLGANLLTAAIWQIDFETKQVTLTDRLHSLPGLDRAMKMPFERGDASGSPRIDVGVSDAERVSLLVDLGFNGGIAIPSALFERTGNRVPPDAPTEIGTSASTVFGGAESVIRLGRLRGLRIGALRLRDFPVVTGDTVSDFHVGIDFLRHFRVTLDWQSDDLYLEPSGPERALYPDYASYGFNPQLKEGALVVGALWRGSAAERAGLRLGDRVLAIDERQTGSPDFPLLCAVLDEIGSFGRNAAPIEVTVMRDEGPLSVTLARAPLLGSLPREAEPTAP
jgi:hypothetical protein